MEGKKFHANSKHKKVKVAISISDNTDVTTRPKGMGVLHNDQKNNPIGSHNSCKCIYTGNRASKS